MIMGCDHICQSPQVFVNQYPQEFRRKIAPAWQSSQRLTDRWKLSAINPFM
jgi:hypothetical protein